MVTTPLPAWPSFAFPHEPLNEGFKRDLADASIRTDFSQGAARQRSVFRHAPTTFTGQWAMTPDEFALFSAFQNVVGGGKFTVPVFADISGVKLHGGGSVLGANVTVGVDPSVIGNLPRFHGGTAPGLNVGETLAVLKDNEYVDTAEQRQARLNTVQQPQVYMLPAGAGSGNSVPSVTINMVNNSGTALSGRQGSTLRKPDGGLSIDFLVDQVEQKAAQNIHEGNSPIASMLEQTHGITRQPSGS